MTPAVNAVHSSLGSFSQTTSRNFLDIPQGNHLFHPKNLLTHYLKQTVIMEPLIRAKNELVALAQEHRHKIAALLVRTKLIVIIFKIPQLSSLL